MPATKEAEEMLQNWEQLQAAAARAAAAPADQRSADAAAVAEAAALLCEAEQLLPLGSGEQEGRVRLTLGSADRRRVLRALALAATAEYVWPTHMPPPVLLMASLCVYGQASREQLQPEGGGSPLERALLAYAALLFVNSDEASSARQAREAVSLLADADQRAAVAAGLAQLARDGGPTGRPLLSVEQLHYVSCYRAAAVASILLAEAAAPARPPRARAAAAAAVAELHQLVDNACRAMLALEPDSPLTMYAALMPSQHRPATALEGFHLEVQLWLRVSRQGAARGSDYWAARGVARLLQLAGAAARGGGRGLALPVARAALAAADPAAAERALERCRRALPAFALEELEDAFAGGRRLLAEARREAASRDAGSAASSAGPSGTAGRQPGSNAAAAAAAAAAAQPAAAEPCQQLPMPRLDAPCAGCGRLGGAPGNAMCHRCRKVRYCSRQCQAGHWRKHKQSCEPWVFAQRQQAQEAAPTSADGPEA